MLGGWRDAGRSLGFIHIRPNWRRCSGCCVDLRSHVSASTFQAGWTRDEPLIPNGADRSRCQEQAILFRGCVKAGGSENLGTGISTDPLTGSPACVHRTVGFFGAHNPPSAPSTGNVRVNARLTLVCFNRAMNFVAQHEAKTMRPCRSVFARCRVASIPMRLAQDRQDCAWS
jgi:hypothetical protein